MPESRSSKIQAMRERLRARCRSWFAPAERRRRLDAHVLEDRILYSATPMPIDAEAIDSLAADMLGLENAVGQLSMEDSPAGDGSGHAAAQTASAATHREVLFVDSSLDDLAALLAQYELDESAEIYRIDSDVSGIDFIGNVLAASTGEYSSIHIVTHGGSGSVQLGATLLSAANIGDYQAQLTSWGLHLTEDADILIYGCDLAATEAGISLIDTFSAFTGADIAASDDLTGHADLGGNWQLEYQTGVIESGLFLSPGAASDWEHILAIVTVSTTSDNEDGDTTSIANLIATPGGDGVISLREAIKAANNTAGADTIAFNIAANDAGHVYYQDDGLSGQVTLGNIVTTTAASDGLIGDIDPDWAHSWWRISVTSALPGITGSVTLDGLTQTGAVAGDLWAAAPHLLRIEIDGTSAGDVHGLLLYASDSTVRGLVVNNFDASSSRGAYFVRGANTSLTDNLIGTDVSGTISLGNRVGVVLDGSFDLSGTAIDGNLISGNTSHGIGYSLPSSSLVVASNVTIQDNFIGTDMSGLVDLGNGGNGAWIGIPQPTLIHNLISGNNGSGIIVNGGAPYAASDLVIQQNYIGTDISGTNALGNSQYGIHVTGASTDSLIGGTSVSDGNIIAFNALGGIAVTNTSTASIMGNAIYNNTGLGIDLSANGVTANDPGDGDSGPGDGDSGPNSLQNYPVLSRAVSSGGNTTVTGTLNSSAGTTYRIEFFSNATGDASGYGEGQTYLGFTTATTDGSGNAVFSKVLTGASVGQAISATATVDLGGGNYGDTSEFGLNQVIRAISGTIFEDINYGGGAGRDFATAAAAAPAFDIDAEAVTVELYDAAGNFLATTTTDSNGAYTFGVTDGSYQVRVVNSTVLSNRVGATAALRGVQTYRTDASGGTVVAVTDHVGGETPNEADAAANSGAQTLSFLDTQAGLDIQSLTSVVVGGASIGGLDFGFNFDTIVNTNDSGQGSLRQFLLNSNALANTNLAQAGQTAGKEVSIFMISDGLAHAGLNTAYSNLLNGTGVAVFTPLTALPNITDAFTIIDGTTQTSNVGDSNSALLGSGATVGTGADGRMNTGDEHLLALLAAPEIELSSNGIYSALNVLASDVTIRGLAIRGFATGAANSFGGYTFAGAISVGAGTNHTTIEDNVIGSHATAFDDPGLGNRSGSLITLRSADNVVIQRNLLGFSKYSGINTEAGSVDNLFIQDNEIRSTGLQDGGHDGVNLTGDNFGTTTVRYNLFENNSAYAIDLGRGQIVDNTFNHNGWAGEPGTIRLHPQGNIGVVTAEITHNVFTDGSRGIAILGASGGNQTIGIISQNAFFNNGTVAIDVFTDPLTGSSYSNGVSPNDGQLIYGHGNQGIDYPVFSHAMIDGGMLFVRGFVGAAAGDSEFAWATIELFVAADDGTQNGAIIAGDGNSQPHGEGSIYVGTLSADANGNFNGSIALPVGIVLGSGDAITATATLAGVGTSEFSANASLRAISGRVFEDIAGNSLVGAEAIGDSNNPGVSGVTVKLYKDGGDGVADGVDDVLVGTTSTTIGGVYNFVIDTGTYWTVIDSKSVASSSAFHGGFTQANVWAEQTYGVAGAASGIGFQPVSGALYAGRNLELSDNAATLATAEHVTRVIVTTADIGDIDSGFSFSAITTTRDGDDDLSNPRSVQGSLRQFIQNSNALTGIQTSGFRLQTSDSNYSLTGGGEYTLRPSSALPTITDAIVLDGTSQAGYTTSPIVELDGRNAGPVEGLRLVAGSSGSTIRGFAIDRFASDGIKIDSDNNTIAGNLIGLRPEASSIVGGAVGWWQAENNVIDGTGNTSGVLNNGATYTTGIVGQAFSLDGIDDFIDLGNSSSLNVTDFTLEAWVLLDAGDLAAGKQRIISRDDLATPGADGREMYTLFISNGRVGMDLVGAGITENPSSGVVLTAGWHHLAATRAGDTLRIFADGLQVAQRTGIGLGEISPEASLVLGAVNGIYSGEYFGGAIDEAAVYNRALSAAEVNANYTAGLAAQTVQRTGLVAWIRADGGGPVDTVDGHAFVNTGATETVGRVGQGMLFSDSGGLVAADPDEFNLHQFTYGFWFNRADLATYDNLIGRAFVNGHGWTVHMNPAGYLTVRIDTDAATNQGFVSNVNSLDDGNWHFGAVTMDMSTRQLTISVDGGSPNAFSYVGDFTNPTGGTLAIGRGVVGAGDFDGKLDEVQIFNRVLLPTEINALYAAYSGTANAVGGARLGVNVNSGSGNVIGGLTDADRNVISNNAWAGIGIGTGVGATQVIGNLVGTDVTGTLDFGNAAQGIHVAGTTAAATIGGMVTGSGNVISSNGTHGIEITGGTAHVIQGNFIGTDATGTLAIGNASSGIYVSAGTGHWIGGSAAGAGNVISGNSAGSGIYLSNASVDNVTIAGNYIGTDVTGTSSIANNYGVFVLYGQGHVIGGSDAGSRNVISGNTAEGVRLQGSVGLPTEMVGWWRAENDANDAMGANHGTLVNGATFADGQFGRAFSFDGVDDYVDLGTSAASAAYSALTLEAWVSPTSHGAYGSYGRTILSKTETDGFAIRLNNGVLQADLRLSGGNVLYTFSTAPLGLNDWSHVVVTYDGSFIRGYVDGTLVGSVAGSGTVRNTVNATTVMMLGHEPFGNGPENPGFAFHGLIDEAAVYSRALTADEIAAAYRASGSTKLGNRVEGNYIGTNAAGNAALANGSHGVAVVGASGEVIGGLDASTRNVISGNASSGVYVIGSTATHTQILGNYIGTDASGTTAIGNGTGVNIGSSASHTSIGGSLAAAGNVISGNAARGILLDHVDATFIDGNYIGTTATGLAALGNGGQGIFALAATNNTIGAAIGNVISGNAGGGILLLGSDAQVANNLIGVGADGSTAVGNAGIAGLDVRAANVTAAGNTISGNLAAQSAVYVNSSTNFVFRNNIVGLDVTGTSVVANATGVRFHNGGSGHLVENNTISGNNGYGIMLQDFGSNGVTIQGNRIGTAIDGTTLMGNLADGINVFVSSNHLIGGVLASQANIIRGNSSGGIKVSSTSVNNRILGNSISSNGSLGIDLGSNAAVNANDLGDADTGANNLQNFAVITEAITAGSSIAFKGSLNSEANTTYRIEFFASAVADGSGYGEGERYLGYTTVTTDSNGNASFRTALAASVTAGEYISTTTTVDLGGGSYGDTSEFSQSLVAVAGPGILVVETTVDYAIGDARYGDTSSIAALLANKGSDGLVSLREAIAATNNTANTAAGADVIQFGLALNDANHLYYQDDAVAGQVSLGNIATTTASDDALIGDIDPDWAHSWWRISAISGLPTINQATMIDGLSQVGAEIVSNRVPVVELSGSGAGAGASGLYFANTSSVIVEGLAINGFADHGIRLHGVASSRFSMNNLGTDISGTLAIANGHGMQLYQSNANTIGTNGDGLNDANEFNVIAGNMGQGIRVLTSSSNNVIAGNRIGTNVTGMAALANGSYGVLVDGASSNNRIGTDANGTSDTFERNVISGNNGDGILIGNNSTGNTIAGNYIGTNAMGDAAIGNVNGIYLSNVGDNTIGGQDGVSGNLISGNTSRGVYVNGSGSIDGAISWWKADNNVNDALSSNNATLQGSVTYGAGVNGSAFTFDSADDVVTVNNAAAFDFGRGSYSFDAWVYLDGTSGTYRTVASDRAQGGSYTGWWLGRNFDGRWRVEYGSSTYVNVFSDVAAATDRWVHLAFTVDRASDVLTLFVDGQQQSITADVSAYANLDNAQALRLGREQSSLSLNGRIDSAAIYGRALTIDEVAMIHAIGGAGKAGNIVAGNLIGTDATGTSAIGNADGVALVNAYGTTVGGSTANQRNIISGNTAYGINAQNNNSSVHVSGNYIGTDVSGMNALGNQGVAINSYLGGSLVIGGETAGERNVISGNASYGVFAGTGNRIIGNYIGAAADGNTALWNGAHGVYTYYEGATVGGDTAGERNIIADGILLNGDNQTIQGNYLGLGGDGVTMIGKNLGSFVEIQAGTGTLIGGSNAGEGNLFGSNSSNLLYLGAGAREVVVVGNTFGLAADGTTPRGSGGRGITVVGTAGVDLSHIIGGVNPGEANIITNYAVGVSIQSGRGVTVRGNEIYDNLELGINVNPYYLTANDGNIDTNVANADIDYAIITAAAINGAGHLVLNGYVGINPAGDVDFAGSTIDFYVADNSPANQNGEMILGDGKSVAHGEGRTYVGTLTADGNGLFSGSIALPGGVSLTNNDQITATATMPTYGTSEFGANATLHSLSGRVFEDIGGNLIVGTEAIGDVDNPGVSGVTVRAYQDGGDGIADGTDDILVGTTTTAIGGSYEFDNLYGTYWIVVDSRTVVSNATLNPTHVATETWAEQTYGVAGAASGIGFQPVSGALYGGRNLELSDNVSSLSTAEHVTRVIVSAADVVDIDSGFSFSAITRTGDGDDDLANARSVQGSLRQFIQNSNAFAGMQVSGFRLHVSDSNYNLTGNGEWTIRPTSALPNITDGVMLDGLTQAGASADGLNGQHTLKVMLDGVNLPNNARGLSITTGGGSTIRGLSIVGFGSVSTFPSAAIHLTGDGGNVIETNFIGVDVTGAAGTGSYGGVDIETTTGTAVNRIGGPTIASRNVIANNANNVYVHYYVTTPVIVQGNYIGTDVTGTIAMDNSSIGVNLEWLGGASVQVGGLNLGEGNVISGNNIGIHLNGNGLATDNNTIQGNLVGVASDGVTALGNGTAAVLFQAQGHPVSSASFNRIESNVIAGSGTGIRVTGNADNNQFINNFIGTDATNTIDLGNAGTGISFVTGGAYAPHNNFVQGNTIRFNDAAGVVVSGGNSNRMTANSIYENAGLAIDLGDDGVTLNDASDSDTGPNGLQNYPLLSLANFDGVNSIHLVGSLHSNSSTTYRVEFFVNRAADPSGHGEAERYLGAVSTTTDIAGNAAFDTILPFALSYGEFVTATATVDLGGGSLGSTSEFSQNISVNEQPVAAAVSYSTSYIDTLVLPAPGILAGTVDPDGDNLTAVLIAGPASGSLTLRADGSLSYNPVAGFIGRVAFVYYVTDGLFDSLSQTVTIDVHVPFDVPPPLDAETPGTGKPGEGVTGEKTVETRVLPPAAQNAASQLSESRSLSNVTAIPPAVRQVADSSIGADQQQPIPALQGSVGFFVDTARPHVLQAIELEPLGFRSTENIFNDLRSHELSRLHLDRLERTLFTQVETSSLEHDEFEQHVEAVLAEQAADGLDPVVSTVVGTGVVVLLIHLGNVAAALFSSMSVGAQLDPLSLLKSSSEKP